MRHQQVWGLPFGDRPVLDFELNAARIEVRPVAPGEAPRVECHRHGPPLTVTQSGETVVVRVAGPSGHDNPWGGNPFEQVEEARHEHMRRHGRERYGDRGSPFLEGLVRGVAGTFLVGAQGGSYILHVPPNLRARLLANMSEVRIHGLSGCDLDVATNAGALDLEDCRGRFKLAAKAGRVRGVRVGGTFEVQSGMGEAQLDIVALDDGTHRVVSTMGSVKVELAPGLNVKIDARTTMGSTRVRYPTLTNAAATILLEAELGSVRVREGSPYVDPRHGDWADWRKVWKDEAPPASVGEAPAPAEPQGSELRRILDLVQQKKVSPEEAERLISALHGN
jgi:hypothetical protein